MSNRAIGEHPRTGIWKQVTGMLVVCLLMAGWLVLSIPEGLYAADDVKIKLTDSSGVSEFAIQDSGSNSVFRVDSDGNTKLYSLGASAVEFRLYNPANTFYSGFKSPVLLGNRIFTLPLNFGSAGQALVTTDAIGTLSWADREPAFTTLGIAKGGTNNTSFAGSKFLYYDGSSIVASAYYNTDFATAGHTHTGTYEPAFTTLGLTKGGTGQTTANAAFNALAPLQTGQSGKYLTTNGTDTSWATIAGGGITSLGGLTGATQTFGNDTNVTMSSASTTHTLGWTGTLSSLRGGTNLNTSASTGVPSISAGTWSVNTTLPISLGGTGQTAQTAAFDALAPTTTKGDIIVYDNAANNIRLPVGADNQVLTVDSTQAAGVKWATPTRMIGKTADQSVNNSTVLVSDTALQFTMEAGATYVFIFKLLVTNGSNAGPDWKAAILASTGISFFAVQSGSEPLAAAFPQATTTDCTTPGTLVNAAILTDAGIPFNVEIQGRVTDNGSAGTVYLRFAQNTATAVNLTVKAGSYVTVSKQ